MKKTKSRAHKLTPASPTAAQRILEQGNADFARLLARAEKTRTRAVPLLTVDAASFGLGKTPVQSPFAMVVGCSDARVPVEIIFQKGCNCLFVVRVAGNVLSSEGLGSMDFAASQFPSSMRLAVVLGHTRCGAVTAAVEAFLMPMKYLHLAPSQPLRSVLDHLFISVRAADRYLRGEYGPAIQHHPNYRDALIYATVHINAAMAAHTLQHELRILQAHRIEAVFGIYDLETYRVSAPVIQSRPSRPRFSCLVAPPDSHEGFRALGRTVVRLPRIRMLLEKASV